MKLLCFFLFPFCLTAQKEAVRQEIEQINRAYGQMTELRTEIDYIMYATHTPGAKQIDRQHAVLSRKGDSYHYQIGEIETMTTPSYKIAADHEDKALTFDKVRNPSERSETQFGLDMETALEACDSVSLSEPTPGTRKITLEIALPDLERVELYFDPKTHLMQKVILFYREEEEWEENKPATQARMELIYQKQDAHPVFAKDLFSIDRFVRKIDNGGFTPAPRFKNYAFINQTNIQ